jgi:hypothetical protein
MFAWRGALPSGRAKAAMMKNKLFRSVAGGVLAAVLAATAAQAQAPPAPEQGSVAPQRQVAAALTPGRVDQLLAPIALYPDDLLVQILMAATYPLDVVEAARWVQDPRNSSLKGDQLFAALQQQNWDASVKSLAPFPRILIMMDVNLEWTERLGEAFLADPGALMEAIQRLRRRAQSAGRLVSTPQAIVQTAPENITIETPSPEIVYVPVCNPSVVYGGWSDPAYPPYSFGDFFSGASAGGFGCGWVSWPIVPPLWGWAVLIFRDHHIHISRDRSVLIDKDRPRIDKDRPRIDKNRPPIDDEEWRHQPSQRGNVPYRDAELAARYGGAAPKREILRAFGEYPARSPSQIARPVVRPPPERQQVPPLEGIDPDRGAFVPRVIEPFGRGAELRTPVERGFSERTAAPAWALRGGGPYVPPPLAGGGIRAPPSPGGAMPAAPIPGGGLRGAPVLGGGMRAQ